MLRTLRKSPDEFAASARVTLWVRARFALAETDVVLVTEVQCALTGCPPIETVIAFWTRTPGWPDGGVQSKVPGWPDGGVQSKVPGWPDGGVQSKVPGWPDGGMQAEPAGRRHHYKIFKPVAAVVEDDLPPAWMKRELAVPEDFECTCC